MKQLNNPTISTPGRKGQALIETIVAISVLTVGFLGVITLLSRALSLNRVVADSYKATYLAEEGIEVTKNILDGNTLQNRPWNDGFESPKYTVQYDSTDLETLNLGETLRFEPTTGLYNYETGNPTPFIRTIEVERIGTGQNEIQVDSTVTWSTRGGGSFTVTLEDHFYNWRP